MLFEGAHGIMPNAPPRSRGVPEHNRQLLLPDERARARGLGVIEGKAREIRDDLETSQQLRPVVSSAYGHVRAAKSATDLVVRGGGDRARLLTPFHALDIPAHLR